MASNSKKRPPTPSCDGHELKAPQDGTPRAHVIHSKLSVRYTTLTDGALLQLQLVRAELCSQLLELFGRSTHAVTDEQRVVDLALDESPRVGVVVRLEIMRRHLCS